MARPADLLADIRSDADAASRLEADAEIARLRSEVASLKSRYKAALGQIDRERERADAIAGLAGMKAKAAKPGRLTKTVKGSATVIVALSDWHGEERVDPATVGGSTGVFGRRIGRSGQGSVSASGMSNASS